MTVNYTEADPAEGKTETRPKQRGTKELPSDITMTNGRKVASAIVLGNLFKSSREKKSISLEIMSMTAKIPYSRIREIESGSFPTLSEFTGITDGMGLDNEIYWTACFLYIEASGGIVQCNFQANCVNELQYIIKFSRSLPVS